MCQQPRKTHGTQCEYLPEVHISPTDFYKIYVFYAQLIYDLMH